MRPLFEDLRTEEQQALAEAVRAEIRLEKGRGVFRRGRDGRYEIVPRIR